jgi:hypothetical protein
MTLIARVQFRHAPIYIGDLLVSSPSGRVQSRVDIPLRVDVNSGLPEDSTFHISGLRQKLNLISPRLLVSFAGNLLQAYSMINALRELDQSGKLSLTTASELISSTPESDKDNLVLIGTIIEPKRRGAQLYSLNYRATQRSIAGGVITAGGSGEVALRNFLPNLLRINPVPLSDDNLYDWADLFALNLASNLFGRELFAGKNLVDMWGGGFEVATFQSNDTFAKLDDILFIFFGVILSPNRDEGAIKFLPFLVKNQYFEDALLVRITECEMNGRELGVVTDRRHLVAPLVKNESDYDLSLIPKLSYSYRHLCCFLLSPDKKQTGVSIYRDLAEEPQFVASIEDRRVRFSFRRSLYEELEQRTSAMMGVPCHLQFPVPH